MAQLMLLWIGRTIIRGIINGITISPFWSFQFTFVWRLRRRKLSARSVWHAVELGEDPVTMHLADWEEALTHWAKAMKAGYTLRCTADDRATFAAEIRWCARSPQ